MPETPHAPLYSRAAVSDDRANGLVSVRRPSPRSGRPHVLVYAIDALRHVSIEVQLSPDDAEAYGLALIEHAHDLRQAFLEARLKDADLIPSERDR